MKKQFKDSQPALGDDRFNTAGYNSTEANVNDPYKENVFQAKDEIPTPVSNKHSSETSKP
ncbi:hypothetical protein ACMYUM_27390 (plasmid) [Priestia megaterium]|uniref:hypothetical protein n=1 Tax=Priestia TaxID=2800373 RepID=UPI00196A7145|nr:MULTISPECIES: hypothetical protein [Priestia]MCW1048968.1 hypothetical protein [Priestia sp. JV24]QSF42068.1 hypothetical protein ICR96_29335 [Priestia megaterium]